MRKISFYSIALGLILVPVMAFADTDPTPPAAPSTGDTESSASAPAAPSTGDTVSSASDSAPAAPSTGDAVSSTGASSGSDSSSVTVSSGGSSSSSSGSSGSFSGSSGGGSVAPASVPAASCPLITATVLRAGIANDTDQVDRLQGFLDIPVTGVFDAATVAAVESFQGEYLSDTMGPWGVISPTGIVSITTKARINNIACGTSDALSAADLALIASFKANVSVSATSTVGTSTSPLSPDVGANIDLSGNASQAAAAGSLGSAWDTFWSSIWNFIKSIF
jgi:hypothetical protein